MKSGWCATPTAHDCQACDWRVLAGLVQCDCDGHDPSAEEPPNDHG
jgi:hypothetical protein